MLISYNIRRYNASREGDSTLKKVKGYLQVAIVVGCLCAGTNVYATEGVLPIKPAPTPITEKTIEKTIEKATEAEKKSTIKFDKEEYVRITQPLLKDEIQTFDSQINVMGEARVGTELLMVTYTGAKVDNPEDGDNYTEYKVKVVGATQTFNQLIQLHEGTNHIIIYYTYKPAKADSQIQIVIERKSEIVKEQIKSYIVTDPGMILDQLSPDSPKQANPASPVNPANPPVTK